MHIGCRSHGCSAFSPSAFRPFGIRASSHYGYLVVNVQHHIRAAVYRIRKFMIPLYHRCTEVDVPISYNPKIYNERQEISCRRVELTDSCRRVGLSPRWPHTFAITI